MISKTPYLNASRARLKLLVIRARNAARSEEMRLYNKYRNYIPVGQRISYQDPYGEENWDE